jgi:hypothetical protein
MTDVLYVVTLIVFFAMMLGLVFLYGRRTCSPEFDASGLVAKSDGLDPLRSAAG